MVIKEFLLYRAVESFTMSIHLRGMRVGMVMREMQAPLYKATHFYDLRYPYIAFILDIATRKLS